KNLYLPQFFKENYPYVDLCLKHLDKESIKQYQAEERTLITFRLASSRYRIKELLDIMSSDEISLTSKIAQLKKELNAHLNTEAFSKCQSMGQVVKRHLKQTLQRNLLLVQKNLGKNSD
ncbi:MAG: hypothetical protein ACSLE0_18510, partial [Chitinophagaceae bacterium]